MKRAASNMDNDEGSPTAKRARLDESDFDVLIDDVVSVIATHMDDATYFAFTHTNRRLRSLLASQELSIDAVACVAAANNFKTFLTWISKVVAPTHGLFPYRAVFTGCLLGGHHKLFADFFIPKKIVSLGPGMMKFAINQYTLFGKPAPSSFSSYLDIQASDIGRILAHSSDYTACLRHFFRASKKGILSSDKTKDLIIRMMDAMMIERPGSPFHIKDALNGSVYEIVNAAVDRIWPFDGDLERFHYSNEERAQTLERYYHIPDSEKIWLLQYLRSLSMDQKLAYYRSAMDYGNPIIVDMLVLSEASPAEWTAVLEILRSKLPSIRNDYVPGVSLLAMVERMIYHMPPKGIRVPWTVIDFFVERLCHEYDFHRLAPTLPYRGSVFMYYLYRHGYFYISFMYDVGELYPPPVIMVRGCPEIEIDMIKYLSSSDDAELIRNLKGIGRSLMNTCKTPDYLIELVEVIHRQDPNRLRPVVCDIRAMGLKFLVQGKPYAKWLWHWHRVFGPASSREALQLIYKASVSAEGMTAICRDFRRAQVLQTTFAAIVETSEPLADLANLMTSFVAIIDQDARQAFKSITAYPRDDGPDNGNAFIECLLSLPMLLQTICYTDTAFITMPTKINQLYPKQPHVAPDIEITVLDRLVGITNGDIITLILDVLYDHTQRPCPAVVAYLNALDLNALVFERRDQTRSIEGIKKKFSSHV